MIYVISTFKPFKLTGTAGIVPAVLQQRVRLLMPPLCHIFRTFLARGHTPKAWRRVSVMIVPRPRNANYTKAKAYCPISLSSFMLKMMEKLVHRHIRDKILG